MAFFQVRELLSTARSTFMRFPIVLLWAIFGAFYLIQLIENHANDDVEWQVFTINLGISWLIGGRFFIEQRANPKRWIWIQVVIILGLAAFYVVAETHRNLDSPSVWAVLYLIAGHAFLVIAPFLGKYNTAAFWNYFRNILVSISRSIIYTGIVYAGLSLALLGIEQLFGFNIKAERYLELFVLCSFIVNTFIYLSDFERVDHNITVVDVPKAIEVLGKYILMPLLLLYAIILYAYVVKIILAWELPNGWVTYLVVAYAALGMLLHLLISPIQRDSSNGLLRKLYPAFYYSLIPLVILLFIAIGRRTGDYGLTVPRYYVWLLAGYIAAVTLYMIVVRNPKLRMWFVGIFVLAILSSFGPWGAIQTSLRSQYGELKTRLACLRTEGCEATQYDVRSILNYLMDYDEDFYKHKALGLTMEQIATLDELTHYQRESRVREMLGVDTYVSTSDYRVGTTYRINSGTEEPQDISGFNRLYSIPYRNISKGESKLFASNSVRLSIVNQAKLIIERKENQGWEKVDEAALGPLLKKLINGEAYQTLKGDDRYLDVTLDGKVYRLIIEDMRLHQNNDDLPTLQQFTGKVLYNE